MELLPYLQNRILETLTAGPMAIGPLCERMCILSMQRASDALAILLAEGLICEVPRVSDGSLYYLTADGLRMLNQGIASGYGDLATG